MQQQSTSNQQGPPQDDEKIIDSESSVDLDLHDMPYHDTEEVPQKETNEDDPSREDVENAMRGRATKHA